MADKATKEEQPEYPDDGQEWLYDIVTKDVTKAVEHMESDDSPYARRLVVRTAFAAMEGIIWKAKNSLQIDPVIGENAFTPADVACLREETYHVAENGKTQTRASFVPMTTTIKMVVRLLDKNPAIPHKVDLAHRGFANLQSGLALRHRLTHPKTAADLQVSKKETREVLSAFHWVLSFALRVGLAVRTTAEKQRSKQKPRLSID